MKKVIILAALATLFATTAAAQEKVSTNAATATTVAAPQCKKSQQCPHAKHCQGKATEAKTCEKHATENTSKACCKQHNKVAAENKNCDKAKDCQKQVGADQLVV